jgi:hypothetical protein
MPERTNKMLPGQMEGRPLSIQEYFIFATEAFREGRRQPLGMVADGKTTTRLWMRSCGSEIELCLT